MMDQTETLLAAIKLVTVVTGFFIVYLGWKAYKRQRQKSVFWMAIGILILTLGAVSEGAAFQGLQWSLEQSHIFEAVVTLAGFLVLIYSLYVK